ncbi:MAG: FlgD immunoglobulin-like domain containing protein [Candidatus Krumholzibacteriota bacterium]
MKKLLTILSIALVMISSGIGDLLSETGVRTFTEDFSSDNYLDLENSSARWEPARGDLRLPAYQIERLSSYETPGKAWNALIHDFRLYISNGYSGVQVYDLSGNPETPFYIGFYDAPGNVQSVFVAGDSVYVACGPEGYKIINRALLYAPGPAPDSDDRNFVKSEFPETTDNIMNYINPGNNILGAPLIDSYTFDIEIARDSLAVIAQWDSVKIVKVKSENRRYIYDIVDGKITPSGAMEVQVVGNYIFLTEHNYGLRVLSFADIDAVMAEYPVPGKCYGFDISGGYLYLAAAESGLYILDIGDPESPALISTFDTDLDALEADGYAVDVTIAGDYAYVSEWGEAVVVVDISDPANPVLAGYSELEDPTGGPAVNWPWGVAVNDTLVYVADYTGGLKVLRASPSYGNSSYVGRSLPVSEGINEISRVKLDTDQEGEIGWRVSADGGSSWQEIEPDNSWHLLDAPGDQLVWESTHYPAGGWTPSSCSALSIQYEGAVATLLSESNAVFDESAVRLEWSLTDVDEGVSFIIMRSNYPEERFTRLAVVDADGELEYSYDDRSWKSGSTYHYRVYLEDEENQTLLFNSGPVAVPVSMLSLYQNEPNPFNPSTRIKYNLPERTRVALNIYDVSGRMVKSLVDKVQDKGLHSVVWNGRDNAGRAVSSGVYFYTLNSEAGNLTRKLVLLR